MSLDILLKLDLFRDDGDVYRTRKDLLYAIEMLVFVDRNWLHFNPETPALYEAGVRYLRDPRPEILDPITKEKIKVETWCNIPEVIRRGGSDCKNLAAWRCAELREEGFRCRPYLKWRHFRERNFTLYHVIVQYEDEYGDFSEMSRFEDPSKLLGMGES